jgi:pyrimidine operon attenuation protein / uracil phosphoribosyltransferase
VPEVPLISESNSKLPPESASCVLDAASLARTLERVAREILERHPDPSLLSLIGIPSRGVELARRLGAIVAGVTGVLPFCGTVDISMHRDDIGARGSVPPVQVSLLPRSLKEGALILVDDVLQSGRTCRAAMDALSSFGRPARIEYAVLVDRGERELPIAADYTGKIVSAGPGERVFVRLQPVDLVEGVWMERVGSSGRRGLMANL